MQKQNRVNKDNPADSVLSFLSQRYKSKAVHIRGLLPAMDGSVYIENNNLSFIFL